MRIKVVCTRGHRQRPLGWLIDKRPEGGPGSTREVMAAARQAVEAMDGAEAGAPVDEDEVRSLARAMWELRTGVHYRTRRGRHTRAGDWRTVDTGDAITATETAGGGRTFAFTCTHCPHRVQVSEDEVHRAIEAHRHAGRDVLDISTFDQ